MDKLIINARERPYSPDIMDMQAMVGRAFSDFMRYRYSEGFNANSAVANQKVCYGLTVTSSPGTTTTDVVMTPGVLMQLSTTIVPAPGALDSSFRIGVNRNSVTVPLPNPGSATWYTLEAQVTETTSVTEVRDILDTITGQFVATNVAKRKEWSCGGAGILPTLPGGGGLEWRTGTAANIPVPTGGDWVTLASFLVQPGGTILTAADAVDMRPVAKLRTSETRQGWSRVARVPVLRTVAAPIAPLGFLIRLAVEKATTNADSSADSGGALDLSVGDSTSALNSFDAQAAAVIEPATAVAANKWYYLYLCPFYNVAPEQQRQGPAHTRGVLVLSENPPDDEGLFNSVPVVLPAPFSNYTVPAYQAPCVGALRSSATNTSWLPMSGGNGEYVIANANLGGQDLLSSGTQALTQSKIPKHAKQLRYDVDVSFTGTPNPATQINVVIGETGAIAQENGWASHLWQVQSLNSAAAVYMTVPRRSAQQVLSLVLGGGGITIGTLTFRLVGYTT